ncbi:hypothetical protein HKD37_05G012430 [Glycine soja]
MDDFSEDEDQQFFDLINHQSDDQTDDEGVGKPTTPPLQYQQPRTVYSDQRRLNFVYKLHENGCTWSLGACNSKRQNKWIIKSIRGHHTCLMPMLRQDHRQLNKHIIAHIIQPIVKTNPIVFIKMLIAEIKMFMNYNPSYKKTWLAKQRALEMIHRNWKESYAKLPNLFRALQSYVPGAVVAAQTESLYEGGEIVAHTRKRCTGDILGISVRISQVQLNGLINYPNKNGYNASIRGNVGDI